MEEDVHDGITFDDHYKATLLDNEKIVSSEIESDESAKSDVEPAKSEQVVKALDEDTKFVMETSAEKAELEKKAVDDFKPGKKAIDDVSQPSEESSNDATSTFTEGADNDSQPERKAVENVTKA